MYCHSLLGTDERLEKRSLIRERVDSSPFVDPVNLGVLTGMIHQSLVNISHFRSRVLVPPVPRIVYRYGVPVVTDQQPVDDLIISDHQRRPASHILSTHSLWYHIHMKSINTIAPPPWRYLPGARPCMSKCVCVCVDTQARIYIYIHLALYSLETHTHTMVYMKVDPIT